MRILIQRAVYVDVVLHFIMAYLKSFMASLHFLLSKIYDAENLPQ